MNLNLPGIKTICDSGSRSMLQTTDKARSQYAEKRAVAKRAEGMHLKEKSGWGG
jgi:hypothetical protein